VAPNYAGYDTSDLPSVTSGIPAASPTNTLRQDLKTNDLRNWTPTTPVLLCAGDPDPTAFYRNTQLMRKFWTAISPPTSTVTLLDVDSAVGAGDPYADLKKSLCCGKGKSRHRRQGTGDGRRALLPCSRRIMADSFRLFA